jgi:hypothetical protein
LSSRFETGGHGAQDDNDRIDCVNNLMLASAQIHLAWDQMEIAIDPLVCPTVTDSIFVHGSQAGNGIIEFEPALVPYRSPVTFSHRAVAGTEPIELLLLHHLRQCFLACIPRTTSIPVSLISPLVSAAGPASSPSTIGLPSPSDKPPRHRRSPRLRRKMSDEALGGGREAASGNRVRMRDVAMNATQLERIERWLMDVR